MLTEFIQYVVDQIGQPYLWGGQHTRLTPLNYKATINKREANTGCYPDGTSYAQEVIDYCEKQFAEGKDVLYAYDCSGLGCYWLYNLMKIWKSDVNANTMMGRCELREDEPKRGWWVFRLDGKRASHIGYMVDDKNLVEAKGRKYGVVPTKFRKKDWHCWGIPDVFKSEIVTPPAPPVEHTVEVVGGSVYVRDADSKKGRILFTAHRGDTFPYVGTAPSGWYEVSTRKGRGFITNLPRYTKLV